MTLTFSLSRGLQRLLTSKSVVKKIYFHLLSPRTCVCVCVSYPGVCLSAVGPCDVGQCYLDYILGHKCKLNKELCTET